MAVALVMTIRKIYTLSIVARVGITSVDSFKQIKYYFLPMDAYNSLPVSKGNTFFGPIEKETGEFFGPHNTL